MRSQHGFILLFVLGLLALVCTSVLATWEAVFFTQKMQNQMIDNASSRYALERVSRVVVHNMHSFEQPACLLLPQGCTIQDNKKNYTYRVLHDYGIDPCLALQTKDQSWVAHHAHVLVHPTEKPQASLNIHVVIPAQTQEACVLPGRRVVAVGVLSWI